jgi:hypothetical protein
VRSWFSLVLVASLGCVNEYHPEYHPETTTIVNYGTLVINGRAPAGAASQVASVSAPVATPISTPAISEATTSSEPAPVVLETTTSLRACDEYLARSAACVNDLTPADSAAREHATQALTLARTRLGALAARNDAAALKVADDNCKAALRNHSAAPCAY